MGWNERNESRKTSFRSPNIANIHEQNMKDYPSDEPNVTSQNREIDDTKENCSGGRE